MESQYHGNAFEDTIIYFTTGVNKTEYSKFIPYTASMDIQQGTLSDSNVSVKTSKDGKYVCGADALNFYKHTSVSEFKLVVGVYHQTGNTKRYGSIYEFDFSPDIHPIVWGGLSETDLLSYKNYITSIPAGRDAQKEHNKIWKEKRKALMKTLSVKPIIQLNPKIDSKNQRRLQCSMTLNNMVANIPYTVYTNNYKGLSLPYDQQSPPRARSSRTA